MQIKFFTVTTDKIKRKCSNAVGSSRQRSRLDRTATSVWQRERAFVNLSGGTVGDSVVDNNCLPFLKRRNRWEISKLEVY